MALPLDRLYRLLAHKQTFDVLRDDGVSFAPDAVKMLDVLKGGLPPVQVTLFFAEQMIVDPSEDVSWEIFRYGFFEPHLTAFFLRELKSGQTFVDAGSHYGYFALLSRKCVGALGRVICFEPMQRTAARLRANVAQYDNVIIIEKAVWSEPTKLSINDFGATRSAYASVAGMRHPTSVDPEQIVTVDAISIDSALAELRIIADIIKIDVESAELEALIGLEQILTTVRPIVTLEVGDYPHLMAQGVVSTRCVLQHIRDRNYQLFEPLMHGISRHEISDGLYEYNNIFCIPEGKIHSCASRID